MNVMSRERALGHLPDGVIEARGYDVSSWRSHGKLGAPVSLTFEQKCAVCLLPQDS